MKVYIVYEDHWHDTGTLHGAYSSLKVAKDAWPDEYWQDEGWYVQHRDGCVSQGLDTDTGMLMLIYEREVQI